ncbi:bifunctional acetate--CoA ligase family protein/GNAT family N-acetyltransferase [Polycladidibacter stylochi]|uniref:bifunctional acetate--CoA ligase family protein/GNAT family N-acetyltransferase n=1 Tax=Polycladidibacter stylochi TaxID=1807766 RepID=UPI000836D18C|nr:bifunctional acetate--CoA ligase family protein/GNAT family N-acetyltransferase [Pseudovibrio stylochi]
MTILNLEGLLAPKSIGIIGPNSHQDALLERLFNSIEASGFKGEKLFISSEQHSAPQDYRTYENLAALKGEKATAPDLAILLSERFQCLEQIKELGAMGVKAALLPSAGFEQWEQGLQKDVLEAARPYNLRILGPGSLGVASPHANFSALLTQDQALKGDLALISRSGTIFNATLAWAKNNRIGFSGAISLGRRLDVDISDLLDWYAMDYRSKAILMHLETIENPRKFLSAARAAARAKPVIIIRSGSSRDQQPQGVTHSGRLATRDAVYDAALQRAGVLRVDDLDEMFEAVETVTRVKPPSGKRLSILANGRSLATLAADRLKKMGGELAQLSEQTQEELGPLTRLDASSGNPLILSENASPEEFHQGLEILMKDKNCDGILAVAAPNAFSDYHGISAAIAAVGQKSKRGYGKKPAIIAALSCGGQMPREKLDEAGVPCHASASDAVRGFMHLVRYKEAQQQLMATPESLPAGFKPNTKIARRAISTALQLGKNWLTPIEIRDVLSAYHIPQVEMYFARTLNEVQEAAKAYLRVYAKLVIKISSPDLIFKSDVGGVQLDLDSPEAAREAARLMLERLAQQYPSAKIDGFEIQPQVGKHQALETYAGLADDPVFGPVVVFGRGGTSVEIMGDRTIDLVPLDMNLAQRIVQRSNARPLLEGFRNRPPANQEEVSGLLVKLSQIAMDFPEIRELDLNPVVTDHNGVLVLDARIAIAPADARPGRKGLSRLSIVPYPKEWEHTQKLKSGASVFIRPIRPEDQQLTKSFFENISQEDLRLRFFAPVKEFSHGFLAKLVQLDYARAIAFAAFDPQTNEMLGMVRLHSNPDHTVGEYAVMVKSNLKGHGLGWTLMQLIINYARADGIATVKGEVLRENTTMLAMCKKLGFKVARSPDDDALTVVTLDVKSAVDASLYTESIE